MVEVVVVAVLVTALAVIGVLLVVRVEACVEVVGSVCNDSFSSFGSTNPGGNIFDTSS